MAGASFTLRGEPGPVSTEALEFVAALTRRFAGPRDELLARRAERQARTDSGTLPDFLRETAVVRKSDWTVAPAPADLRDRRVELTTPIDREAIAAALASDAKVVVADFESATVPTWKTCLKGHDLLWEPGRTVMVRPRGWHIDEEHMLVDKKPIPAALLDFGLHAFHGGRYFSLPSLECHLEARLWNEIFCFAQEQLGVSHGTMKATASIESIHAVFEMDEILYELRDHSAGLHCGRWGYILGFIETFQSHARFMLPERGQLTMEKGFLRAYDRLLIRTCHRRGAHAIGGLTAQIPVHGNAAANQHALDMVCSEKLREVRDGHDGTWVAHPDLVPVAMKIFDLNMNTPNQIFRTHGNNRITRAQLLEVPEGTITDDGLRANVRVGLCYLESRLRGTGWVSLDNNREDADTAGIARAQLRQWIRHGGTMHGGRRIDAALVRNVIEDELESVERQVGPKRFGESRFEDAAAELAEF